MRFPAWKGFGPAASPAGGGPRHDAQSGTPAVEPDQPVDSRRVRTATAPNPDSRDPLTGLADRAAFVDAVAAEVDGSIRHGQPFALVYVKLGLFDAADGRLGNLAGVHLFRQVANRFLTCLRGSDLVGRLEEDEFGIVLPGSEFESALVVALRTKAELERPYGVDGVDISFPVAFGVACYPEPGSTDAEALIRRARDSIVRVSFDAAGLARSRCPDVRALGSPTPPAARLRESTGGPADEAQLRVVVPLLQPHATKSA